MNILISNASDKPIYEQIFAQIKAHILSGALEPGQALPSIRALAKDLRVSVITTKRAYDELEQAGYVNTVPGKGCFVAKHEGKANEKLTEDFRRAVREALDGGADPGELIDIIKQMK